jgi:hypothetical protein
LVEEDPKNGSNGPCDVSKVQFVDGALCTMSSTSLIDRNVPSERPRAASALLQLFRSLASPVDIDVCDGHRCAGLAERSRRGTTDGRSASTDEQDPLPLHRTGTRYPWTKVLLPPTGTCGVHLCTVGRRSAPIMLSSLQADVLPRPAHYAHA